MNDMQSPLDGLTVNDLRAGRKALYQAKMTGTLSVQYQDGTRVTYRAMAEIDKALRDTDARIAEWLARDDPQRQPVRAFRVRPWNGFY